MLERQRAECKQIIIGQSKVSSELQLQFISYSVYLLSIEMIKHVTQARVGPTRLNMPSLLAKRAQFEKKREQFSYQFNTQEEKSSIITLYSLLYRTVHKMPHY